MQKSESLGIRENRFKLIRDWFMTELGLNTGLRVESFRNNPWTRAFKNASLPYKVPYTMRHTFAAWSLTLRMDPNRLVRLMGHSSKKMVYDVYGNYVEGLEEDAEKIYRYFGEDFISPKRIATPSVHSWNGESFGESQHLATAK